ncbi:hypothetical protein D3C72_2004170 [compost metagenome]
MVFVDQGQRDIALAGIRQGDADRPGIQIEDRGGVKRIAVGSHDGLGACRYQLPPMEELAQPCPLDGHGEIPVRLGTGKIVDRYRYQHARQYLALRSGKTGRKQRARRQQHFPFVHRFVLANSR